MNSQALVCNPRVECRKNVNACSHESSSKCQKSCRNLEGFECPHRIFLSVRGSSGASNLILYNMLSGWWQLTQMHGTTENTEKYTACKWFSPFYFHIHINHSFIV